MANEFIKQNEKIKLQVLSYYQIAGGILGIGLIIRLIAETETVTGPLLLIFATGIGLYSFSIFCGRQLLTGKIKRGLKLSTVNQILQILQFALLGFAFQYVSGIMLTVGIDLTTGFNFKFNLNLSMLTITINREKELLKVGVNIIAIFLVFFIDRLEDKIEQDRKIFEASVTEPADPITDALTPRN